MIGVQVDVKRMLAIAEALRQEIPKVSSQAARPMIDAAGELQRLADQVVQASELAEKVIASRGAPVLCQCPDCTARRAVEAKPNPENLN